MNTVHVVSHLLRPPSFEYTSNIWTYDRYKESTLHYSASSDLLLVSSFEV